MLRRLLAARAAARLLRLLERRWLHAAGVLAVVVVGALVHALHYVYDHAEAQHTATSAMGRARADLNALESLEWQAFAAGLPARDVAVRIAAMRSAFADQLARAEEQEPHITVGMRTALQRYDGAVDAELALLTRGRQTAARRLHAQAAAPRLRAALTTLDRAQAAARARTVRAHELADREAVALLTVAALVLAVSLVRATRAERRRAVALSAARTLERSERRFRSLVSNASEMITVLDASGRVRSHTGAALRTLGHEERELVDTPFVELVHPADRSLVERTLASAHEEGGVTVEWRLRHADGSWLLVETAATCLLDDHDVRGIVLTTRDIEERKRLEEQLRHRAFHDPLTQLPNRALFIDRLEHALSRDRREGSGVGILFVDLDDFKATNDELGHAAGDELLVSVGARLRSCLRSADTAARLGGDEFGVLLEWVAGGEQEALRVGERILAAFQAPFVLHGHRVEVRPSLGIAAATDGVHVEELLRRADVAMYAAKRRGKGRIEVHHPALAAEYLDASELSDEPERATWMARVKEQRQEIEAVLADPSRIGTAFQPIVDLRTGLVTGYEALCRIAGETRRPPNVWFAQAHRCGLGPELEAAAIRAALAAAGDRGGRYLSLNFSPTALLSAVGDAALPSDLSGIVVEVTETELVAEGARLEDALKRLRARGARIAVDDAGAGYAGFSQLIRLRPDIIKLDRSLVTDVDGDPVKAALIESFVRFARWIGAVVCAEGLETLDELRTVADLDVTYGQGYVFARPGDAWPSIAPEAAAICSASLSDVIRLEALHHDQGGTSDDWRLERLVEGVAAARTLPDLEHLLGAIAAELHADGVALSTYDRSDQSVETIGHSSLEVRAGDSYALDDYPATAYVLRERRALQILVSDPNADPAEAKLLRRDGISSLLMIPVMSRGRSVGLFEIHSNEERPWSRSEIARARILAYQTGPVLEDLVERRARDDAARAA